MSVQQPRTAWVYIRESKDASASGHNPDNQERMCRAMAAEMGLTITHLELEIKPAASMTKRPTWKAVQRAALRHEFDALIVWEYSRIARNTADWMHFISRALNAGVDVLSTDKEERRIDWHTPMGRAMLAMIGSFNEMEREKTRERTMQGNQMRALKGMPLVGHKPLYGYRWVEEASITDLTGASRERKVRFEPDELEAARVRAIWNFFDTPDPTHTLWAGTNWLNFVQKWPSPKGKMWHLSVLRHLLHQPYYWGEGEAFRTIVVDVPVADTVTGEIDLEKRQRQRPPAQRIRIPATNVPPLISKEQALRVFGYLDQRAQQRQYRETTHNGQPSQRAQRKYDERNFLLTGGVIRCGVCGKPMIPRERRERKPFYYCGQGMGYPMGHDKRHHNTILQRDADAFAITSTFLLLTTPGQAEAAIARLDDQRDETDDELHAAEAELARQDAILTAQQRVFATLTAEQASNFAVTHQHTQRDRDKQAEKVLKLRSRRTNVETLTTALARAVQQARARSAALQAADDALDALDAEVGPEVMPEVVHQLALPDGLYSVELEPGAGPATVLYSLEEAQALARFLAAPVDEQRTVMRGLGVHVLVKASKSGGQKNRANSAGVANGAANDRLDYALPLDADVDGLDTGLQPSGSTISALSQTSMRRLTA